MNVETTRIDGIPTPVSRIGLGTWAIGGWMWGGADDNASVATIRSALDQGINLIDTAPVYGFGHSEEVVGKALAGMRQHAVIATKVALEWGDGGVRRNSTPGAYPAGNRGFTAPLAHRLHRPVPGALAGHAGAVRRHRG
ncbi:aldo/keto reductase [Cupriavidus necator]